MEFFFSGTVIFLYFLSCYAAEPIFLFCCMLPTLYSLTVMLFLRFGGCGKMITAAKRAKRFVGNGVISADRRALFYKKCVKNTPPAFRAAYALFAEGKSDAGQLAAAGVQTIRVRKGLLKGGLIGVGIAASLLVFLTFYFLAPISETLLRTAICAFFASLSGVVLHFVFYGITLSAERAVYRFACFVDDRVLRKKPLSDPLPEPRPRLIEDRQPVQDVLCPEEQEQTEKLRAFLLEAERRASSPEG